MEPVTVRAARARPAVSSVAVRALAHPVTVAALVVLVANDRVGKSIWPGPVTGIASDLAGLVLLPVVLAAVVDACRSDVLPVRTVAWIAALVAVGFAAVELVPVADLLYEHGLGWAGAPFRGAMGLGGGRTIVVATPDPFDLLALPAAAVAPWLWHRSAR